MKKSIYTKQNRLLLSLLRETRILSGLTQKRLSSKLKKPQSFVSKYESGERRIDLIELRSICRALKIPLAVFIQLFERKINEAR